jgi:hypothetical protein
MGVRCRQLTIVGLAAIELLLAVLMQFKRGVEFTQPPAERPYGIEAILRDDSGNWFSFTQRTM